MKRGHRIHAKNRMVEVRNYSVDARVVKTGRTDHPAENLNNLRVGHTHDRGRGLPLLAVLNHGIGQ